MQGAFVSVNVRDLGTDASEELAVVDSNFEDTVCSFQKRKKVPN